MSRESSITIEKNLNKTRLQNGKVKRQKVSAYLRSCESIFDVIFADPPYDFSDDIKNLEELFFSNNFYKILKNQGIFILETRKSEAELPTTKELVLKDVRVYGDTQLNLFIRQHI